MTNEEILANAPEGATHVSNTGYMSTNSGNKWIAPAWVDLSGLEYGWHSLSDIRRIVELEKEVERLNAHSLIFDAASELNDDLKQKLEAVERELENERMMSMKRFVETGRAERFAIQQKIEVIGEATKYCISKFPNGAIHSLGEFANQLRQQLNGG